MEFLRPTAVRAVLDLVGARRPAQEARELARSRLDRKRK
jgi:hypothetical protein